LEKIQTCVPPTKPVIKPADRTLLIDRLHRALGPLAGAMILDAADFVTVGPIGIFAGLFVGAATGWWISSIYQYSNNARMLWSLLAGLYCTIPFTAIIPFATLISVVGRFFENAE
jgi:hypothetical protein